MKPILLSLLLLPLASCTTDTKPAADKAKTEAPAKKAAKTPKTKAAPAVAKAEKPKPYPL